MHNIFSILNKPDDQISGATNDVVAMALEDVLSRGGDARFLNSAYQKAKDMVPNSRRHYHADISSTIHITDSTPQSVESLEDQT